MNLIYLDEFQVTNIVDAMILGKLFEKIFEENIKIIITTNTKINNLYKDGLQREQFLPFLELINKKSVQKELILEDDYRTQNQDNNQRIFYPLNEKTLFKITFVFQYNELLSIHYFLSKVTYIQLLFIFVPAKELIVPETGIIDLNCNAQIPSLLVEIQIPLADP